MTFDVDEEILADFLVEAGEILEQLQGQLVELENNPEDANLLNAIFRGYHTVKGGAGFLSLNELVDICHGAENVFDVMRNGQRALTPELMDVILQATDEVVQMFELVKAGDPLVAVEKSLIDTLTRLSKPESLDEIASVNKPEPNVDVIMNEQVSTASGDFSEDEFEALLDELHGDSAPTAKESSVIEDSSTNDQDISDDEFEALLDQLHGKGQFKGEKVLDDSQVKDVSIPENTANDDISDDEFEALLDQLHGKGKGPADEPPKSAAVVNEIIPVAEKPTEVKKVFTPVEKEQLAKPVVAKKEEKKSSAAPQAETTVRVDTKRLDQIMNMVGELVLVRNRLLSLSNNVNNESMAKAIANLDVVTGDLQGAVMKTRMQPIKKVFGRFPRVVRDLARTLKKEITLELEGEETDLDKNLVEALADPLVHLVRNSVDLSLIHL